MGFFEVGFMTFGERFVLSEGVLDSYKIFLFGEFIFLSDRILVSLER